MKTTSSNHSGNGIDPAQGSPEPRPDSGSLLQPLREVGSLDKTQFWDLDEIYQALREANRLGIAPERLFRTGVESGPQGLAKAS